MSRLPKILSTRPKYCPRAHMSPRAQNIVHGVALSTGLWLKVCISMPRKLDDSGILIRQAHKLSRRTICNWNRYLARDPPSYDSGTLLSETDPE